MPCLCLSLTTLKEWLQLLKTVSRVKVSKGIHSDPVDLSLNCENGREVGDEMRQREVQLIRKLDRPTNWRCLSCCLPALKPERHALVQLSLNYHLLLHCRRKSRKNTTFPCWQDSADSEHYILLNLSVDLGPTKIKTCILPQVRVKSKWTQYMLTFPGN